MIAIVCWSAVCDLCVTSSVADRQMKSTQPQVLPLCPLQVRDLGGSFTAETAHAQLIELTGMEAFQGTHTCTVCDLHGGSRQACSEPCTCAADILDVLPSGELQQMASSLQQEVQRQMDSLKYAMHVGC